MRQGLREGHGELRLSDLFVLCLSGRPKKRGDPSEAADDLTRQTLTTKKKGAGDDAGSGGGGSKKDIGSREECGLVEGSNARAKIWWGRRCQGRDGP